MTSSSTRPRHRRYPLSPLAIVLALLMHAFLFGIMFIKVDSHVKPMAAVKALEIKADEPVDIIEATAVDNEFLEQKKQEKLAIEREQQRKIEAEKQRIAKQEQKKKEEARRKKEEQIKKQQAEEKRKKEAAQKKAEAKKKADAEKKKAEAEKKAADEKKKAEAEKKAVAEKKRKDEERKKKLAEEKKRKAAAEKKRKAEEERKREEGEMRKQMEAKARAARASQAMSKYVPRIQSKVQDNWNYPPRGPEGCNPTVRVNLAPDGKVLNAKIVKSSGDPYCDSSVEKAFIKASPIPIPLDPDLYSEFKIIDFPFRP